MADRPTRPVPRASQGEDPPPGKYHPLPAHSMPSAIVEPIGRIALRAPRLPAAPTDPRQEELLRAIASTEGRMLADASDWRESFEEKIRLELKQAIIREVKSLPPPPPLAPPKRGFEWAHLQYVGGLIVALTGLVALILNAQKPSTEVLKRFDALDKKLEEQSAHSTALDKKIESNKLSDYEYKLSVRSWVTDVFERASGVKIDDPPGTPPRDPLGFYPPPKIDPHKVTGAHPVQPRDPYPVPPPP